MTNRASTPETQQKTMETTTSSPKLQNHVDAKEHAILFFNKELTSNKTTLEAQLDLKRLGEQIQGYTNTETLALHTIQNPEKSIEEQGPEQMFFFNIYVGRNIIGSLYKSLLEKYLDPKSGLIDTQKLQQTLDPTLGGYDISSVAGLRAALRAEGSSVSASEEKILKHLEGDSKFAQEYKSTHFASIQSAMHEHMQSYVQQYNNEVSTNDSEKSTFGKGLKYVSGGIKNLFSFDGDKIKKDPLQAGVGAATLLGGGYVAYKAVSGIIDWFSGDEEDEDADSSKKKKNKKGGFWNILKTAGMVGAGVYLVRGIMSGDWDIPGLGGSEKEKADKGKDSGIRSTMRDIENGNDSYESIDSIETKESLRKLGENTNDFIKSIQNFDDGSMASRIEQSLLGEGKDQQAGVIPHILDNTFDNINHMNSKEGFFKLCVQGDISSTSKTLAEYILGNKDNNETEEVGSLSLVSTALGVSGKTLSEQLDKGLDSVTNRIRGLLAGKGSLEDTQAVFRKCINVMTYTNYAENVYMHKTISKLLQEGKVVEKDSGGERETASYTVSGIPQLVKEICKDPEAYKIGDLLVERDIIQGGFRQKKLRDVALMDISINDIKKQETELFDEVKKYNEERDKKVDTLDSNPTETLSLLERGVEKELGDSFRKSLTKTIPAAHLLKICNLGTEEEVKEKLIAQGGFREIINSNKTEVSQLRQRIEAGGKVDKKEIQACIDDYYANLKEIATTTAGIYEAQDKNGNIILTIGTSLWSFGKQSAKNIFTGFSLTIEGIKDINNGEIGSGAINTTKGLYFLGSGLGAFMLLHRRTRLLGVKLIGAPVAIPAKLLLKIGGPRAKSAVANLAGSTRLTNRISTKALNMYSSPDKIIKGMTRGLSSKHAFKFYKDYMARSGNTSDEYGNFVKKILKIDDLGQAEKLSFLVEKGHFKVIDQLIETKGHFTRKHINLDAGLKELDKVFDFIKTQPHKTQQFGFKLLQTTPTKDYAKYISLFQDKDIITKIEQLGDKEISQLGKQIAQQTKKGIVIDKSIVEQLILNKGNTKLLDLNKQNTLKSYIDDDIAEFRKRLSSINNSRQQKYYEKLIKQSDELKLQLKHFSPEQYSNFKRLRTQGLDTPAILKVHNLADAKPAIKAALHSGDINKISKILSAEKQAGAFINNDVIELFTKIQKSANKSSDILKGLSRFSDEAAGLLKTIAKLS